MSLKKTLIIYSLLLLLLAGFNINSNWYSFESKSFGFKIEFPQKPTLSSDNAQTELGVLKIKTIVYDAEASKSQDDNLTYLVNYIEYPASKVNSNNKQQLQSIYENTIKTTVQNTSGKLIKTQVAFINGYEGRNIIVDMQDKVQLNMRVVLVNNKMYLMQVFTKSNKSLNESLKRFMKSFVLL
ncbi:hypothetical protein [Flavobacterium sp.]|uniref:hypothetical protein n=1 Tax=Flavobacterium sp. TaxID=239 RepID=UPI003D6C361F